jgi:muconolactone delta-isomerase
VLTVFLARTGTAGRGTRSRAAGCGGVAAVPGGSASDTPLPDREAPTMEYLVTMTTSVPDGTPEETVDDIRAREAARSRQLAVQGHLFRLWRPPLRPGEWRTLGLFAAADAAELEQVLASMPLRVWRTDELTPLSPHPNDPARYSTPTGEPTPRQSSAEEAMEFLTTFRLEIPEGTPDETVDDATTREAERARELAEEGHLLRLWIQQTDTAESPALGLWRAEDGAEMETILESLPLYVWMTVTTVPLSPHPNDPARTENH